MTKPLKVLKVCAIDATAWLLLRTQMEAMRDHGWEVSVTCSPGAELTRLEALGIKTLPLPIARSTNLVSHLISVWRLYRLMRRERFDVVHVHTPVASLVGRLAARLANVPLILYTAHGFYFHDEMPSGRRGRHVALERLFGRLTHHLFTQSAEDAETAVVERIMPVGAVTTIGNGVILEDFADVAPAAVTAWRDRLGLPTEAIIIGIVGRVVEEKGYREYFQAARELAARHQNVHFVVVGSAFRGDRDGFQAEIENYLQDPALRTKVHFTGFTTEIPALMRLLDVFALPSYREGMPRSIIEAMAAALPVIATDIRGCREEVVEGETGYLVPTRDWRALAERLDALIVDPALRRRMGAAGLRRAQTHFHERMVIDKLIGSMETLLRSRGLLANPTSATSEGVLPIDV